jgi:hypothetical protein
MTDRQLIDHGVQTFAALNGFPDRSKMRQRDHEYLCDQIEKRSGILISLSTMKRLLNGQYNRLPQVATLNALSVCLGYADWQAFRTAKSPAAERPSAASPAAGTHMPPRRRSRLIPFAGVALLLLIVILSWSYFSRSPAPGDETVVFSVRKTTQNAIPNTVVFTYDIDRVEGDSFFIQQSWDRNRRVRIGKNSHTLTDIYYEPGYHTAKLFANDRIVKTLDVSLPTDKWFLYAKESFTRGLPAYIQTDSAIRRGILGIDKPTLIADKIDPEKPQIFLTTFFPTTIRADADNFRLTARIKTTEVRNTACPFIMTEVYCQRGFMYSTFTIPGCTGGISARFGDHIIDGQNNDLSALAFDVLQWHDVDILVQERQVTVSIDGKAVMRKTYTAGSGLITGLGFHSNGLCAVDSIHLAGLDGKTVYPPM